MIRLDDEERDFVTIDVTGQACGEDCTTLAAWIESRPPGYRALVVLDEAFEGLHPSLREAIPERLRARCAACAIVCHRTWRPWADQLAARWFAGDVRVFETSELDAARAWLASTPPVSALR